jgi:phospholipase/carboxylesterase
MSIPHNLTHELLNSLSHDQKNAFNQCCLEIIKTLFALESVMRQLYPPLLSKISQALDPYQKRFCDAYKNFSHYEYPKDLLPIIDLLQNAADHTQTSLSGLIKAHNSQKGIEEILKALRSHANAQEIIYPFHKVIPVISKYFLEASMRDKFEEYDKAVEHRHNNGILLMPDIDGRRNGYYLYVPETYDESEKFSLVVALHGGSGTGKEFIWFWLREARTRRFILLAPSSSGRTWSFNNRADADLMVSAIDEISDQYNIDKQNILLTGFSDGGIYTIACALMEDLPFTVFAPISGVLHPSNLSNAKGKHIYQVHGTLDWMFSVSLAKQSYEILKTAGAKITYREITDLSHTYPREENDLILTWFNPSLSLQS